jgi:hypothetical protein
MTVHCPEIPYHALYNIRKEVMLILETQLSFIDIKSVPFRM